MTAAAGSCSCGRDGAQEPAAVRTHMVSKKERMPLLYPQKHSRLLDAEAVHEVNFGTRRWQIIFRSYRKGTGNDRKAALCSLQQRADQTLQKAAQAGSVLYRPDGSNRKHGSNGSPRPNGPDRKHGPNGSDGSSRPNGSNRKYGPNRSPRPDGKHRPNGSPRPNGPDRKHGPNGPDRSPRPDGSNGKYGPDGKHRPGRNGSGSGISVRLFRSGFSRKSRDAAGFRPERGSCGDGGLPCGKKRKLSSE